MSRRTSGENGLFIVLVLLAVEVWAHKSFMTKVGHYILLACLVGGAIPIGAVIFKFIKKVNRWRLHKYNPNMSTIDNMTGLEFEHYIARLLKVRDFSHIKLTEEYDYGIDIIATKNGIT
jgi:HJR/Mrr/RecB family endonuclease